MQIEGKRILITGANRGLGRALVEACVSAGAGEILACSRVSSELPVFDDSKSKVTQVQLDVTNEEQILDAVKLGPIDILINNAGVAVFGGALKSTIADMRHELEVNYLGVLQMTRAFVPGMIANGGGLVVNISSILGRVYFPAVGSYCVTKAALLFLTEGLRTELKGRGVNVIAVLPATIDTDMSRDAEGPRMSAGQAAEEIIEAIRNEPNEIPIGDQARAMYAQL